MIIDSVLSAKFDSVMQSIWEKERAVSQTQFTCLLSK